MGTNVLEEPAVYIFCFEEAAGSSKKLVPIYQITRYHVPGDMILMQIKIIFASNF
jgi:hypothetical protein